MKCIAFDESAAQAVLAAGEIPEEIWDCEPALLPDLGIRVVNENETTFVLSPAAQANSGLIIFPITSTGYFEGIDSSVRATVLERCLRAGLIIKRPGQGLPRSWAPYREQSYTIFYSTTIAMGNVGRSARSIVQKHPGGTNHILVCAYIAHGDVEDLKKYSTPHEATEALLAAEIGLPKALESVPTSKPGHDFKQVVGPSVPSHGRSLSEWKDLLTSPQKSFLTAPVLGPTKVRGAAGTGKTLALMLKATHELYQAMDEHRPWRGIILTHNWSSAEAIRTALTPIDERGALQSSLGQTLEVATLQELAAGTAGGPSLNSLNTQPISADGFEGKLMQVEMIESLVAALRVADWSVFKAQCSEKFRSRVESPLGSPSSRLLAWDLMNEFACVISATRNTSRESYLDQERPKWMMPLPKRGDREVAYLIHERFRQHMHDQLRVLTTYDVVNDYLRLLDTNAWHLARREHGYDLILVDEFHLFNKQELLVFQYLSRDAMKPPAAVLAMDPRQSPTESFLGFKADTRHPAARVFGSSEVEAVRFDQVFRYSAEINSLLDVLDQCWFGFELEEETEGLPRLTSVSGPKPSLVRVADESRARDVAIGFAKEFLQKNRHSTVAVLTLSSAELEAMTRRLQALNRVNEAKLVTSRDSDELLSSAKTKYVLSQPEFVAGAQFDAVIILDANNVLVSGGADEQLQQRRILSSMYLGISRAKRNVTLIAADAAGGPIRYLTPAIDGGMMSLQTA